MSGYNGTLSVYPGHEMKAIDMAEALRAVSTFSGIVNGCRLTIQDNQLVMTPGWVILGGRVGSFEAPEGSSYITVECPQPTTATSYKIVIVCDLRPSATERPFYIDLRTDYYITNNLQNNTTSDDKFNATQKLKYLTIGSVDVSTAGVPSNLDIQTGHFPEYALVSDKTNLDAAAALETRRHKLVWDCWINYLNRAKCRSAFFRTHTAVGDGLTIPANTTATFRFRQEYGSLVLIMTGDTAPARPQHDPYIILKPDGSVPSIPNAQGAGDAPSTVKQYYADPDDPTKNTNIVQNFYTGQKNLGITGVTISNPSSGASQVDKCVIQSYGIEQANSGGTMVDRYRMVKVRNTGTAAAKIKLSVTCTYVQNIEFP